MLEMTIAECKEKAIFKCITRKNPLSQALMYMTYMRLGKWDLPKLGAK